MTIIATDLLFFFLLSLLLWMQIRISQELVWWTKLTMRELGVSVWLVSVIVSLAAVGVLGDVRSLLRTSPLTQLHYWTPSMGSHWLWAFRTLYWARGKASLKVMSWVRMSSIAKASILLIWLRQWRGVYHSPCIYSTSNNVFLLECKLSHSWAANSQTTSHGSAKIFIVETRRRMILTTFIR